MPKKLKSALRVALLILVSLVLGVNLYTWNARSLLGNSLPMPFGYGAAVVLTGSMEPTIMQDDLILVAQQETYEPDDIVVYQSGPMIVCHRILSIEDETVTTQGDANNAPDAPIRLETIKGEVVGVLPGFGAVARLLKTPAATITLIVAALLTSELSFRKDKQKDLDELEKIKEEIRRLKAEQE